MSKPHDRVLTLSFWSGPVDPEPLDGGITNTNFKVTDRGETFVVRIGDDIPIHQVMRFNERAAGRAAFQAGLSPEIVHAEPGAIVMRFIEGHTLTPEDVRADGMLERIVPLLRTCHTEVPRHLRGPALAFWVFHVLRDYGHTLVEGGSRHTGLLPGLQESAQTLENAVGETTIVFGHNDLLAGNFIDDGSRLWLIDWDYAGFNSPFFDLGNLASNNEFSRDQERQLLELYFEAPPDDGLMRRYDAMKCASLLRETMWSMVSEIHSELDFDYAAYTAENLARFEAAYAQFSGEQS